MGKRTPFGVRFSVMRAGRIYSLSWDYKSVTIPPAPWEMLFGRKVGDLGGSLGILAVPPGEMMLLR